NELNQNWDLISTAWKNNTQSNYVNNPDGTASQVINQTWDGVSTWNNTERLTFTYGISTGLSELYTDPSDFTVYPNPASDFIRIKSNKSIPFTDYYFCDQNGKLILNGKIYNETNSIDISSLANGIYFLHIGEGRQFTLRVIKDTSFKLNK
ncbi:MAG: T9SS type A sorting domain-containing protein, partial [Bacteroidales bacterium]